MVPDGWHKIDLHHLAEVRTGLAKGKKNISDPVSQPYLRVANVQDGHFDLTDIKSITVNRKDIDRYKVLPDDVLLTEGGDFDKLGRGHVWTGEIRDCLHQNHIFVVRCDSTRLLPRFFAYQTASPHGRAYFLGCSKQTTNLASINSTQLREFPVLLPDLAEQLRIVLVLETWDRAIEQTQKLIDAKLQLKRGLMQQLMTGKTRFAAFKRAQRAEYHLGDLFTERVEIDGDHLPLLSITSDKGIVLRDDLAKKDTSPEDKGKYKRILPGDIGYNTMRMWQGVSALSSIEGIVSPAYTVVTPGREITGDFAAYLFKLPETIHLFHRYSQGLVNDTLNLKFPLFAKVQVTIPIIAEQKKIVSCLKAIDTEIEVCRKLLANYQHQKRGLMQVLLTGKVRVKTPSAPAAVDYLPDVRKMVSVGANSRRRAKK